jgi:hypothetical protein
VSAATSHPAQLEGPLLLPRHWAGYSAIDCVDIAVCAVVGTGQTGHEAFAETNDHGQSWSVDSTFPLPKIPGPGLPGGVESFSVIDCVSAARCILGGNVIAPEFAVVLTTRDGGRSWTVGRLPATEAGDNAIGGLYCSRAGHCLAGGLYIRNVLMSNDFGATWRVGAALRGGDSLTGITCMASQECLAATGEQAGGSGFRSDNGGRTWQSSPLPGNVWYIECPGVRECVATWDGAWYSNDGGSLWHRAQIRGPSSAGRTELFSPSCPTTELCVALALPAKARLAVIADSVDGGRTWNVTAH